MATSRLLTINIRNYLVDKPRRKRHMKVVKYVRERVSHYTKVKLDSVRITKELNSTIMKKHVKSMLPLKLNVNIDNGIATVTAFSDTKKAAAPAAKATTTAAPAATKQPAKAAAPAPAKQEKAKAAPKSAPATNG